MAEAPDAELQRKLQPKLRMYANCATDVNALRAGRASAIKVGADVAAQVEPARVDAIEADRRQEIVAEMEWEEDPVPEATVSVFVQLADDLVSSEEAPDVGESASPPTKANLFTTEIRVADLPALQQKQPVAYIELGQSLAAPNPPRIAAGSDVPADGDRAVGQQDKHRFGDGVLIGIIDVGGFDFAHPDFLDENGDTRFTRIWDQGGDTHPNPADRRAPDSPAPTPGLDYGSEVRQEELNAAIVAARGGGLPATRLEPQSTMSPGSHGTHVASIAAGNLGLCRKAWIAGVLISLPESELGRRNSFYDSTRIAHAVDYLTALAESLATEHDRERVPVSINVSLGTNGHAHDDSAGVTRWIDLSLTRPGRAVSVAAGNAGQERSTSKRDLGFVTGRVHSSGQVKARQLTSDIEWVVFGNGGEDVSENELEIWYGPQDRFSVQIKPPDQPWLEAVEPDNFIENQQLADGSFVSVYNELYHPANGLNYIAIYLSPLFSEQRVIGTPLGVWLVRLSGLDVRDGHYHCWIERDDPRPVGRTGERQFWRFPSFFSDRSFVDESTVSSLACGQRIISVANLDSAQRRINITSSQGPTREGREKPDIAAPGTEILAANGFAAEPWVRMTGTSMASPYVAGVVGLMLAANPSLTAAQVGGVIKRTAKPLPGSDFAWSNDAGSGQITPEDCVVEAAAMSVRRDLTRRGPQ